MTAELDLPLLVSTRPEWATLAAGRLDLFLADHAVCEQQAALSALNLVAHYPDDGELVTRMAALAAEEVSHFRRVVRLLHARGLSPDRRRPNPYVQALQRQVCREREDLLKLDRLLVGALIEARSCERFTCLLHEIEGRDPEVADLLRDLGPAERRHWELFHGLARAAAGGHDLDSRWALWLEREAALVSGSGVRPTVHG